jgi:hypothetical protein
VIALSLPVFEEGRVGLLIRRAEKPGEAIKKEPHPALPEDGEGKRRL